MAKTEKSVKRIFSAVITCLLVLSTLLCFVAVIKSTVSDEPPEIFGFRFFYVISGSMEPTIPEGAAIIVKEKSAYEKEDVITFSSEDLAIVGKANTHRVVEVLRDENGKILGYRTKGDANSLPDEKTVAPSQVYGKVVFQIGNSGFLAKVITFLTDRYGFFVVFMLPVLFLAVFAMKDFLKAQKAALEEKMNRQSQMQQGESAPKNSEDKEERP